MHGILYFGYRYSIICGVVCQPNVRYSQKAVRKKQFVKVLPKYENARVIYYILTRLFDKIIP